MDLIKNIVKEVISERNKVNLNEEFIGNDFYVYHVAREESLSSIFKFGFEAYYTASKVGNAYGRGVYSTFSLESSLKNAKRGEYGRIILKCKLKSLKDFLIWDENIARRVYGGYWRVSKQLDLLCPPNVLSTLKNNNMKSNRFWSKGRPIYEEIISYNNYTSQNAHAAHWYGTKNAEFEKCYKGLIFNGPHDGDVAVIRDFKNVIPIEYSVDFGRTWKKAKTDIKFNDYVVNDIDLKYYVGDLYDEVPFHFENNFARVKKNGKYNYLYKKTFKEGVISPIWFDSGAATFSNKGDCLVLLGDTEYILHHKKDSDEFFVLDTNKVFLCYLDDFEVFLSGEYDDDW